MTSSGSMTAVLFFTCGCCKVYQPHQLIADFFPMIKSAMKKLHENGIQT